MSQVKIQGNASGTGIFTIASPNGNTDRTLTLPDNTGTIITSASSTGIDASALSTGTVAVARLAATGTPSASTFLRGDSSWAAVSGGVTSITAGNGLTGGTITTSGTIGLDYYTGTASNNTSFPLGSYVIIVNNTNSAIATSITCRVSNGANAFRPSGDSAVAGTWRSRGLSGLLLSCPTDFHYLVQRVA